MTLTEVLMAIFVMAIGLLSVMALFPLGSASMARAIKDDRLGHAAANAKAIGIARNVRFDPNLQYATTNGQVKWYFDNPDPTDTQGGNDAKPDGPSYPVFVDPVGALSYSTGFNNWIAGNNNTASGNNLGVVRVLPSFAKNTTDMLKWCTLLDDITFGIDGKPLIARGNTFFERGGNYSWAWMLQRPKSGNASVVNMTAVVYSQRALSGAGLLSGKEVAYPGSQCYGGDLPTVSNPTATYDPSPPPGTTTALLYIPPGTPLPQISQGSWVLDVSSNKALPFKNAQHPPDIVTFHRVVSVGDPMNTAYLQGNMPPGIALPIEVAQPWRQIAPGLTGNPRTIITMDGVAEVIDCGTGWNSSAN
jgi:hypothetical protein